MDFSLDSSLQTVALRAHRRAHTTYRQEAIGRIGMVARRAIFHAQELYVVSNDNGERQVFLLEFLGINIQEHLVQTLDRKSTRLNSSHANISYAVFCLKKKKKTISI